MKNKALALTFFPQKKENKQQKLESYSETWYILDCALSKKKFTLFWLWRHMLTNHKINYDVLENWGHYKKIEGSLKKANLVLSASSSI